MAYRLFDPGFPAAFAPSVNTIVPYARSAFGRNIPLYDPVVGWQRWPFNGQTIRPASGGTVVLSAALFYWGGLNR